MSKKKKYRTGTRVLEPIAELISPKLEKMGFRNVFTFKVSHSHNTYLQFLAFREGPTDDAMLKVMKYLEILFEGSAESIEMPDNVFGNLVDGGQYCEVHLKFTRDSIRKHRKTLMERVNDENLVESATTVVKYGL